MSPTEQDQNLQKILGKWPNTYTFTKCLAERTLLKKRPATLPMVILRPSIIGSSLKEPYPGWVDTLAAAGGIGVTACIGILNYVNGTVLSKVDLIPVDFVTNHIIVSTAHQSKRPGLTVFHSSTSDANPITWHQFIEYAYNFIKTQPFHMQVFTPSVTFIENQKLILALFFMRNELPAYLLEKIGQFPIIRDNRNFENKVKILKIVNSRLK